MAASLIGRHTRLDELLPTLAGCLRIVVDCDGHCVVLPEDEWKRAHVHSVRLAFPDAAGSGGASRVDRGGAGKGVTTVYYANVVVTPLTDKP